MSNDWRYSIPYCMPEHDSIISKLPIKKMKYDIYKYFHNPISTMMSTAINSAYEKINKENEKCPNLSACSSYKRFVTVLHEEREHPRHQGIYKYFPEWRYIDKVQYDSLKVKCYIYLNIDESQRIAVTFNEFLRIVTKASSVRQSLVETIYDIWLTGLPIENRDRVHHIYWTLSVFEEIQKRTNYAKSRALFEEPPRRNIVYSYRPLKKNHVYKDIFWYSQHDNYSCGFIQYLSKADKAKQKNSNRKLKYEANRRIMPCKRYHSITDLYYICKNFGLDVSNIDIKTTTKNILMQKIYPNLHFH